MGGPRYLHTKTEAVYGTQPAWTGTKTLQFSEFGDEPNQNYEAYQESIRREATIGTFGGFVNTLNGKFLGRPDAIGELLFHAFGGYAFAAAVDGTINSHTYTVGETLESLSIEEVNGVSGVESLLHTGCLVKELTLSAQQAREMLCDISFQARDHDDMAVTALGTLPALRPLHLNDCTLSVGGNVLNATSVSTKIENTIPDDGHTSGSRLLPAIDVEMCKISGECDVKFESLAQRIQFMGGTDATVKDEIATVAMLQDWDGPPSGETTPYKLDISLPSVVLTENPLNITGRESLFQRLSWEAWYHASNTYTLYNKDTTYT